MPLCLVKSCRQHGSRIRYKYNPKDWNPIKDLLNTESKPCYLCLKRQPARIIQQIREVHWTKPKFAVSFYLFVIFWKHCFLFKGNHAHFVLFNWLGLLCDDGRILTKCLQSNSILTLYEMKYVSLGLQVFTAYSMDYLGRRSGKCSFRKDTFFFMYILEGCYVKPKLTQFFKWREIFWLQITTIFLLEVTFYAKFFVLTHTHEWRLRLINTSHKHIFYWWIHELDICI